MKRGEIFPGEKPERHMEVSFGAGSFLGISSGDVDFLFSWLMMFVGISGAGSCGRNP